MNSQNEDTMDAGNSEGCTSCQDTIERRTIRQWREHRGMTRNQLGRLLDVGVSTIQHWETGRRVNPSATLYRALAQALQVPMEAIILPSEDTPPDSPTPPRGQ